MTTAATSTPPVLDSYPMGRKEMVKAGVIPVDSSSRDGAGSRELPAPQRHFGGAGGFQWLILWTFGQIVTVVSFLLSVTFAALLGWATHFSGEVSLG